MTVGWFIYEDKGTRLAYRCTRCKVQIIFGKPEDGAKVFCCGQHKTYEPPKGWLASFADALPMEKFRGALSLS
jgi:hypothetical protein